MTAPTPVPAAQEGAEKILPCPWCGSKAVLEWADKPKRSSSHVVCDNLSCCASGAWRTDDATAAWNRVAALRSERDALRERVREMQHDLDDAVCEWVWLQDNCTCGAADKHDATLTEIVGRMRARGGA